MPVKTRSHSKKEEKENAPCIKFHNKLKFETYKSYANGVKMRKAEVRGIWTHDQVVKETNKFRKGFEQYIEEEGELDVQHFSVACSVHYRGINQWTPGMAKPLVEETELMDFSYDPDETKKNNEVIDRIAIFVTYNPVDGDFHQYVTPKKFDTMLYKSYFN